MQQEAFSWQPLIASTFLLKENVFIFHINTQTVVLPIRSMVDVTFVLFV